MLVYCVTASLRGAAQTDCALAPENADHRSIWMPRKSGLSVTGLLSEFDGLLLVPGWGGGDFSPNACARVGCLLLHKGNWHGKQLISQATVEQATQNAGIPNHSGLGWWVNRDPDGTHFWQSLPEDAFWGLGAQGQFLLVVPRLKLIVVRTGGPKSDHVRYEVEPFIVNPLMHAFAHNITAPYPQSPVIKLSSGRTKKLSRDARPEATTGRSRGEMMRFTQPYGDGNGFKPFVPEKLSLGFARVNGFPLEIAGENIRSSSGEQNDWVEHV